jgi:hypothetical protein
VLRYFSRVIRPLTVPGDLDTQKVRLGLYAAGLDTDNKLTLVPTPRSAVRRTQRLNEGYMVDHRMELNPSLLGMFIVYDAA